MPETIKTIYKFNMAPKIQMPEGAEVLHVGVQDEKAMIWALVDPAKPLEIRNFHIYGTGHQIMEGTVHLGTAVLPSGLVWHLFEERNEENAQKTKK